MNAVIKTDVLIVGAGPTGLSLACQLTRFGIDFVIIDKGPGVTPFSKAIGVHARTLEIYEQIGLAEKAVEQGTVAGKVQMLAGGTQRGEFDLKDIGEGLSPYPYLLLLEQSKNEALLYDYLQRQGRGVLWNTEFVSLEQNGNGVMAQMVTVSGDALRVEAKYLVGCDGPRSPVRNALGLKFEGSTFERIFYVADVQIDWERTHDALHICLAPGSFVLFFPLKGEKRYRIVGVLPEGSDKDAGEVLYEEIESRIKDEAKLQLDIHDVEWFSTYKVHTRHVEQFSSGRSSLPAMRPIFIPPSARRA